MSAACTDAFPVIDGAKDPRAHNPVECARTFLNGIDNLNNTDTGINRDWKGRVVKKWCDAYKKSLVSNQELTTLLDSSDASLASLMRDTMTAAVAKDKSWTKGSVFLEDRITIKPTTRFSVVSLDPGAGKELAPERYAPSWVRHINSAMGKSSATLINTLNERDGEIGFDDFAESLKSISTLMDLSGSA